MKSESEESGASEKSVSDGEEDDSTTANDGLAEMMSKILNQRTSDRGPVLAKRVTPLMKEMVQESEKREETKLHRIEKKRKREKFLALPDHTSLDFERQLRKVATRGVVALFNAITDAKRDMEEKPAEIDETVQTFKKGVKEKIIQSNSKPTITSITKPKVKKEAMNEELAKEEPKKWSVFNENNTANKKLKLKSWDLDNSDDDI